MKTILKNIATLDARNATQESVEEIQQIKNIGIMLVSEESKPFLNKLNMKNVGIILETPDDNVDVQMVNGSHTLSELTPDKKIFLMCNGSLMIDPGLTAERISQVVVGGIVNGTITGTQSQIGAMNSAGLKINGSSTIYPDDATIHQGGMLSRAEALSLSGTMYFTKRVILEEGAATVLQQAGVRLDGRSGAIVPQAEAETFYAVWGGKGKVVQLPEGFTLMEGDQNIDRTRAAMMRGKRFILGNLTVRDGVTAESLKALESLYVTGKVYLPESLIEILLDKLHNEPEAIPYRGTLVKLEGVHEINEGYLSSYSEFSLIAEGVLTIDPDLPPQVLKERIAMLEVDGMLTLTPEQESALLPVLAGDYQITRANPVEEESSEDEEPGDVRVIKNLGSYIL